MNSSHDIMVAIVQKTDGLPDDLVVNIHNAYVSGESLLDRSYLGFLDDQIAIGARGQEWTNILKARKKAILPYLDKPLIWGQIKINFRQLLQRNVFFVFNASPDDMKFLHWDRYAEGKVVSGSPIK